MSEVKKGQQRLSRLVTAGTEVNGLNATHYPSQNR